MIHLLQSNETAKWFICYNLMKQRNDSLQSNETMSRLHKITISFLSFENRKKHVSQKYTYKGWMMFDWMNEWRNDRMDVRMSQFVY